MNNFWNNKWGLSLAAGFLLGLSFPPVNLSFLSIPAFILFFRLAEISDSNKQLAYFAYPGFVLWNLITTYWLMMASSYAGIAAILANSVLMTIPLIFGRYFLQKIKTPVIIGFLQAAAWTSYEYLHHNWDLAWPWLTIANAWSKQVSIIQYISITGHLGISFWAITTAALSYQAIRTKSKRLSIYATACLLVLPGLSLIHYWSSSDAEYFSDSDKTEVAVIQPNHDSYQDYGGMSGLPEVLDSLFSLTTQTITSQTELIVWPENAIDGSVLINSQTVSRVADSAKTWNKSFIIGTGLFELYPEGEEPDLYRGVYRGQAYNIFNSSLYVDDAGTVTYYKKANLVPIVERVPFLGFLTAIDVFEWVNWGKIAGFGKGTEPTVIATNQFVTGGLVCYDSVYPDWNRDFVNEGVDFITIITNDGWWGNTSGHHQHFAYARLRAIEFDRWIVRSANNGISGIIDPNGRIFEKTDYWVRTGFAFSVPNKDSKTPYTKFGDWLSYLLLIFVVAGWVFARFKKEETILNE